ncbi:hypothetical protein G7046_g6110 [Stylonectria norvegica]|nr:hypothetical protein G7046_g6110 [Stylonectria norvegica]
MGSRYASRHRTEPSSYRSPVEYSQRQYYQSQPLSPNGSSGGYSQDSSIPDSPANNNYYLHHETIYENKYSQPASSPTLSHDSITSRNVSPHSTRDWPVLCLAAGCNAKPFKRCADLQRHYKNTHTPDTAKDAYWCDYPRCTRSRDPFHRRDHFRDHLREFHMEDILKRGVSTNEEWFEGRYLATTWWRCPKCLVRIYIQRHGFDCPECKTSCEPKRKERRRRDS